MNDAKIEAITIPLSESITEKLKKIDIECYKKSTAIATEEELLDAIKKLLDNAKILKELLNETKYIAKIYLDALI